MTTSDIYAHAEDMRVTEDPKDSQRDYRVERGESVRITFPGYPTRSIHYVSKEAAAHLRDTLNSMDLEN